MMARTRNVNVDRGYAWVIVLASFMAHVIQYGIVWTVGIFYAVFLDVFDASSTATSLVSSLNTAVYYLTGPIARILYDRYGARTVAMVGGLIGSSGLILSMFATSIYHLQITFGIITVGALDYVPDSDGCP